MKKIGLILSATLVTTLLLGLLGFSSNKESKFDEVTIGNQVWMEVNLNVDKFRNGDPIPQAESLREWREYVKAEEPA